MATEGNTRLERCTARQKYANIISGKGYKLRKLPSMPLTFVSYVSHDSHVTARELAMGPVWSPLLKRLCKYLCTHSSITGRDFSSFLRTCLRYPAVAQACKDETCTGCSRVQYSLFRPSGVCCSPTQEPNKYDLLSTNIVVTLSAAEMVVLLTNVEFSLQD